MMIEIRVDPKETAVVSAMYPSTREVWVRYQAWYARHHFEKTNERLRVERIENSTTI